MNNCECAVCHENTLLSSLLISHLENCCLRVHSLSCIEELNEFLKRKEGPRFLLISTRWLGESVWSLLSGYSDTDCNIILLAEKLTPDTLLHARKKKLSGAFLERESSIQDLKQNLLQIIGGARKFPVNHFNVSPMRRSSSYSPDPTVLSQMEMSILTKFCQGYTLKEAGETLGIQTATAATYKNRVSTKLGLYSRFQLYNYAREYSLI